MAHHRTHAAARLAGGLIGSGLLAVAGRFLLDPEGAAAGFGVPAAPDDPYLAVKGVRDLGFGLLLVALAARGRSEALGAVLLAGSVVPIGDALVVVTRHGPLATALGVHGATALVTLAAGAVLARPERVRVAGTRDRSTLDPRSAMRRR